MRLPVDRKMFSAFIGCLMGVSQGMTYEPFQTCTETAQVDSTEITTWVDTLETDPPPYLSRETFGYRAGTCMPAKDVYDAYWMGSPQVGNCTLRPAGRINDCVTMMDNGTKREVTMYYAAGGKVDSTLIVETPEDNSLPKETTLIRYLAKTGYDLIRTDLRDGNGPWSQILQDSIVTKGTGKVIYTKGDVNTVTTCIADGNTYACTPVGTSSYGELEKQVWYLTGGRVDSLGTYDLQGVHIGTEKWFWSARSGNSAAVKARVSSPWMARSGTVFDVAGRRLPEPDRIRKIFTVEGIGKAKPD
jgi:hypothetical protein